MALNPPDRAGPDDGPSPDQPPVRPSGLAAAAGPEATATLLVVVLALVIGVTILVTGANGGAGPSSSPGTTPSPNPSGAGPAVDRAALRLAIDLDHQLAAVSQALQSTLAAPDFFVSTAAEGIRSANGIARTADDVARQLAGEPPTAQVGTELLAFYAEIHSLSGATLAISLTDDVRYRAGATALVKHLAGLPALDAKLTALLTGGPLPSSSASAGPSASSSPVVTSPTPVPSIGPTPIPTPTVEPSVSPSDTATPPPVIGLEQLVNPGFEQGVGAPWRLALGAGNAASIAADHTGPAGGAISARVDISAVTQERAGVALMQDGLSLVSGTRYLIRLSGRSTGSREVRIQVVSSNGTPYATRLFTVTTSWTAMSFEFTAFSNDDAASLEIDLGRSALPTWLDDASLAPRS